MNRAQLLSAILSAFRSAPEGNRVALEIDQGAQLLPADLNRASLSAVLEGLAPGVHLLRVVAFDPEAPAVPIPLFQQELTVQAPPPPPEDDDGDDEPADLTSALLTEVRELRRAQTELFERVASERAAEARAHYEAMTAIQAAGHQQAMTFFQQALEAERSRADRVLADQARAHRDAMRELAASVREMEQAAGSDSAAERMIDKLAPLVPLFVGGKNGTLPPPPPEDDAA